MRENLKLGNPTNERATNLNSVFAVFDTLAGRGFILDSMNY